MTRTKRQKSARRPVATKRPSKAVVKPKPKPKAIVVVLSPEQKIKRSLGRSPLHRGRLPVVMDGSTACCIAKMGRRRMAVAVLNDLSPTQPMMIRPSITTTTARAIECVIGSIAEKSQGWNAMHKGSMLMAPMLHRAFVDYCTARGGVWLEVVAECDMMRQIISDNELHEQDKAVLDEYAETEEGQAKRKARLASSSKAQITKRMTAEAKRNE